MSLRFGREKAFLYLDDVIEKLWNSILDKIKPGAGDALRLELKNHAEYLFFDSEAQSPNASIVGQGNRSMVRYMDTLDVFMANPPRSFPNRHHSQLITIYVDERDVLREAMQSKWRRVCQSFVSTMDDIADKITQAPDSHNIHPVSYTYHMYHIVARLVGSHGLLQYIHY